MSLLGQMLLKNNQILNQFYAWYNFCKNLICTRLKTFKSIALFYNHLNYYNYGTKS